MILLFKIQLKIVLAIVHCMCYLCSRIGATAMSVWVSKLNWIALYCKSVCCLTTAQHLQNCFADFLSSTDCEFVVRGFVRSKTVISSSSSSSSSSGFSSSLSSGIVISPYLRLLLFSQWILQNAVHQICRATKNWFYMVKVLNNLHNIH